MTSSMKQNCVLFHHGDKASEIISFDFMDSEFSVAVLV